MFQTEPESKLFKPRMPVIELEASSCIFKPSPGFFQSCPSPGQEVVVHVPKTVTQTRVMHQHVEQAFRANLEAPGLKTLESN